MEYRTLGSTGTIVSAQCLGTMTFGNETDEETAHAQLDRFVERGGNFVDTADVYSGGRSEEIIGGWLAARPGMRDRLVIATKGRFPMGDGPNDAGLSRTHLARALDASLRRLGVDAVDLYQAHAWDPLTPIEETLGFFDDAVRAGKIRYAGVSNFVGWQLQKAALLAGRRRADRHAAAAVQPARPRHRAGDRRRVPQRGHRDPAVVAAGRRLADRQVPAATSRRPARPGSARTPTAAWRRTARATPRSAPGGSSTPSARSPTGRGVSMAQVALAWLADRPAVTSVILGARTVAQLDDNLGAADLHLSDEETGSADEASAPLVADYPYGPPGIDQRSRKLGS